jgi:hypothetical protein
MLGHGGHRVVTGFTLHISMARRISLHARCTVLTRTTDHILFLPTLVWTGSGRVPFVMDESWRQRRCPPVPDSQHCRRYPHCRHPMMRCPWSPVEAWVVGNFQVIRHASHLETCH